jgi:AcrR family transcriptional regulator
MARARKISTVKPQASAARVGSHPTRDKLLEATVELLQGNLPQAITSEMVLKKSGISRGSLYHHFADFSELLEVALVEAFAGHVDQTIALLTELIKDSTTREQVGAGLDRVTELTQSDAMRPVRFSRARLIAFSEDNPRLAAALAKEQQRLTNTLTDIIREGQARDLIRGDVDAHATAVFIQAYSLGRIVDDIVPEKVDPQAWNALIRLLVEKVFI